MGLCGSAHADEPNNFDVGGAPPAAGTGGNARVGEDTHSHSQRSRQQRQEEEAMATAAALAASGGGENSDHAARVRRNSRSGSRSGRSRSRSRSSKRRRRRHHGELRDKELEQMDAVEEEQRHVLDDPMSRSYKPIVGTLPLHKQSSVSSVPPMSQSHSHGVGTGAANGMTASGGPASSSAASDPSPILAPQASTLLDATAASMQELDCVVVLVCDEDESIQAVLEKWLSQDRKYQIVPCCSGDEVAEVLASGELDPDTGKMMDISFIIGDASMTLPEGDTILDWLKSDPATSDIPTIMLCAEGTSAQASDRLIRRGATDVVYKPLTRVSLLNSIDTLFRTRQDTRKVDVLRDRGDEYKKELLRERARAAGSASRAGGGGGAGDIGSLRNQTLSAFTVAEGDNLEPIHVLLIDTDCVVPPQGGAMVLSPQAQRITEWIGSFVIRVVVANSIARAGEIMEEMSSSVVAHLGAMSSSAGAAGAGGGGLHATQLGPGRKPSRSQQQQQQSGGTLYRALGGSGNSGDYTLSSLAPTNEIPSLPSMNGIGAPNAHSSLSSSNNVSSSSHSSHSTTVSTGSAPFVLPNRPNEGKHTPFGIEMLIFDFALLSPKEDASLALPSTSSGGDSRNGSVNSRGGPGSAGGAEVLRSKSMSSEGLALLQRILNQQTVTPVVLLVDDMGELETEYLHLLKNCSVTFIMKPPGKDVLSKKVGLLVESIQAHRAKLKFAYRAQSYRFLLQKIRERKRGLGLSNKDALSKGEREAVYRGVLGGGGDASMQGTPRADGADGSPPPTNSWSTESQQREQPTHGSLLNHRGGAGGKGRSIDRTDEHHVAEADEDGDHDDAEQGSINLASLAGLDFSKPPPAQ